MKSLHFLSLKQQQQNLYVLSSRCFGPNVYKIGRTNDLQRRIAELSTAHVEDLNVVFTCVIPSPSFESKLHKKMASYRIRPDREFFKCPLSLILQNIDILIQRQNSSLSSK
jgi:Meiotically up-regulated gene 113